MSKNKNRYYHLQGHSTPQFAILPLNSDGLKQNNNSLIKISKLKKLISKQQQQIFTTTTVVPRRKMLSMKQTTMFNKHPRSNIILGKTIMANKRKNNLSIRRLNACQLIDCGFRYGTCHYTQPKPINDYIIKINDLLSKINFNDDADNDADTKKIRYN